MGYSWRQMPHLRVGSAAKAKGLARVTVTVRVTVRGRSTVMRLINQPDQPRAEGQRHAIPSEHRPPSEDRLGSGLGFKCCPCSSWRGDRA